MKKIFMLFLCSCAYSPSDYYTNTPKKEIDTSTFGPSEEKIEYRIPKEIGAKCKIGGHKGVDWCWAITSKCWEVGIMRERCSFDCAPVSGADVDGEEMRCIRAGGICLRLDNNEGWDSRKVCVPAIK